MVALIVVELVDLIIIYSNKKVILNLRLKCQHIVLFEKFKYLTLFILTVLIILNIIRRELKKCAFGRHSPEIMQGIISTVRLGITTA